jgi:hypothetical protein
MTYWRRSSGLQSAGSPASVKPRLECLESRIVPDANTALGFVQNFQFAALHLRADEILACGQTFAKITITNAVPNGEGDQRLEADLRLLQYTANTTPLVLEATTLSVEALGSPTTVAAGVAGLTLSIDASAFLAGIAATAWKDIQTIGANPTAMGNAAAFLNQSVFDFQLASVAIANHSTYMRQAITTDQVTQLAQQPDPFAPTTPTTPTTPPTPPTPPPTDTDGDAGTGPNQDPNDADDLNGAT